MSTEKPAPTAPRFTKDAEGRLHVPLAYPIHGFTELLMKRLKVADLRNANAQSDDDLEMVFRLAAYSSGLTLVQLDDLDALDWRSVVDAVTFLQRNDPK